MNKKALIIIGLAVVIAASGGGLLLANGSHPRGADADPIASESIFADATSGDVEQTQAGTEDVQDTEPDAATEMTEAQTDEPTEPDKTPTDAGGSDDEPVVTSDNISGRFTILKVVDHTTGSTQQPRVVLGNYYNDCYLSFEPTGKFELYLNTASGVAEGGTYHIYDNIISVLYDSGIGAEYTLFTSANGSVDYIIVNYGDYDIYFS